MRKTLVAAAALLAITTTGAWSQCSNCAVSGGWTSAVMCCSSPSDTFVTKHEWRVTKAGTLELGGTAFTIVFNETAMTYDLYWRDKPVEGVKGDDLSTAKRRGVARANDMQDAGLDMK